MTSEQIRTLTADMVGPVCRAIREEMINHQLERSDAGKRNRCAFLLSDHAIDSLRRAYSSSPAKALDLAEHFASRVFTDVAEKSGPAVARETLKQITDELRLLWAVFNRRKIQGFLASQAERAETNAECAARKARYAAQSVARSVATFTEVERSTPYEWLPLGYGKGFGIYAIDGTLLRVVSSAVEASNLTRRGRR